MHRSDNEFFEEYKRLDKLCSEMYSCQNGINEYISQMERKAYQGHQLISKWKYDYKMLKHVRWVRNQIAHNTCTYQISKTTDLQFVQDFRKRIFSEQDSLALLKKSIKAETKRKKQPIKHSDTVTVAPCSPSMYKRNSEKRGGIIVVIAVLAIIIFLLLYFYR